MPWWVPGWERAEYRVERATRRAAGHDILYLVIGIFVIGGPIYLGAKAGHAFGLWGDPDRHGVSSGPGGYHACAHPSASGNANEVEFGPCNVDGAYRVTRCYDWNYLAIACNGDDSGGIVPGLKDGQPPGP